MQRRSLARVRAAVCAVIFYSVGWGAQAQAVGPAQLSRPPLPDAPTLQVRAPQTDAEKRESVRIASLATINGRPYEQLTRKQRFHDYVRDSYGLPALARSTVRTLYSESQDGPSGWGQDFPGFMQRFGSNVAITAIDGNVRYGMEELFYEDLRYIPCHGCSVRRKLQNALLSEVTARHDSDGHRFFTLTPAIADFSGPIIANAWWYPNHDPFGGVVGTRTVAATRVGAHLFSEFVLERRHHDRHHWRQRAAAHAGETRAAAGPVMAAAAADLCGEFVLGTSGRRRRRWPTRRCRWPQPPGHSCRRLRATHSRAVAP